MATVVETLVVSLGLDTSALTEGQRRAVQLLRGFERESERSRKRVRNQSAEHLRSFIGDLRSPVDAGIKHLTEFADTAQRSGNVIAKSAGIGAQGLAALAAAGLAAYAVVRTVQGAVGAVTTTVGTTLRTSYQAGWAGFRNVHLFDTIAKAGWLDTGAEQEATRQSLVNFREMIVNQQKFGDTSTPLARLMQFFGVTDFSGDPEEVAVRLIKTLTERLPKMPKADAQTLLKGFFTPEFIEHLQKGPANWEDFMTRANKIAILEADAKAADKIGKAVRGIEGAWNKVQVTLETMVSGPLAAMLNGMSKFLLDLSESKRGIENLAIMQTAAATGGLWGFITGLVKTGTIGGALKGAIGGIGTGLGLGAAAGGAIALGKDITSPTAPKGLPGGDWSRWLDIGYLGNRLRSITSGMGSPSASTTDAGIGGFFRDRLRGAREWFGPMPNTTLSPDLSPPAMTPAPVPQIPTLPPMPKPQQPPSGGVGDMLRNFFGPAKSWLHGVSAPGSQSALTLARPWVTADYVRNAQSMTMMNSLAANNNYANNTNVGNIQVNVPPNTDGYEFGNAVGSTLRRAAFANFANSGLS